MAQVENSMSLANPHPNDMDTIQKIAAAIGGLGLLVMLIALFGQINGNYSTWLTASLTLMTVGVCAYAWREYTNEQEGIKNNHVWHRSLTNRGLWGWVVGIVLTGFYVVLYFFPALLGLNGYSVTTKLPHNADPTQISIGVENSNGETYNTGTLALKDTIKTSNVGDVYKFNLTRLQSLNDRIFIRCKGNDTPYYVDYNAKQKTLTNLDKDACGLREIKFDANSNLIKLFDPLSVFLKKQPASQWFVYGALYTLAILIFGIKFMLKYRHNRYQQFRTLSVMFFQLGFAFLIPEILMRLNYPYNNFMNMWPLNYYFFDDWNIAAMTSSGKVGMFMLVWGLLMIVVISPVLTYFYGKRWYCSWVCGCGGLAETAGDPFRHLSDKSLKAWKIERWMIHSVLVFAIVMTVLLFFFNSETLRSWYGFAIGSIFSGVIGVGFYPIMGSRVWCRFGCPMAAILGLQQRFFSRFRITTNGGQCISCGNCSTYCEMGIDVRAYAQKGQNIVRASCVGCGICAAVCPRGVLRLENSAIDINERTNDMKVIMISEDGVRI